MNHVWIVLSGILLVIPSLQAQISYGGKPLPEILLRSNELANVKSVRVLSFEEMPSFDLEEELRIDSLERDDLRGGYRFAYKFMTNFRSDNSGIRTTLLDGTKVWRVGIRSAGAFSLGVLFTEYDLPEGARLFLYNSSRTHILGAFDHRNNSEFGILPVSPVEGEELIIEYQEPASVAFSGKLTVGEVNHSYRDFRIEPGSDNPVKMSCIPAFICNRQGLVSEQIGRSVVLLIINGTTACTGVMVNNTAADGRPYVLTASHCLNNNFQITSFGRIDTVAGTIVTYFNYDSPLCKPVERGTEEMSMASSHCIALNPAYDMALLELLEIPPVHYRPYYAGWNASFSPSPPFFSIHHPSRSVKRINWTNGTLIFKAFSTGKLPVSFKENSHWFVDRWQQGSTQPGSSGAPLFNIQEQVIGLLTGGNSECSSPVEDYYYVLATAWQAEGMPQLRLAHWLDPLNTFASSCDGLDPYEGANAFRMSNFRNVVPCPEKDTDIDSAYKFDNKDENVTQFAEAYHTHSPLTVFGAYLVTPPVSTYGKLPDVDVCLYTGLDCPEQLLHAEPFHPTYTSVNTDRGNSFYETSKSLLRFQESFIRFETPVHVPAGNFYVGYRINSASSGTYFAVCNLASGRTTSNTAWFFNGTVWQEATAYPSHPGHTSLYIDPVVRHTSFSNDIHPFDRVSPHVFVGDNRRTIHVLLPEGITAARLSVVSSNGFILSEHKVSSSQMSFPVSVPHGLYVLRLCYGKDLYTWKVVL
jgi:hypothetical protein